MRDGLGFNNTIRYRLYDSNGNLKDDKITHNQTQNNALTQVIDALDDGTCSHIITMAIGIGSGQAATDTALSSISSFETGAAVSATQSGTPEDTVEFSATFTAGGSWTITEAGLFTSANAASWMMFYDDSISTSMTSGDTLQIDWTVSVS